MVSQPSLLVLLLDLIEQMPVPPCSPSGRGRPTAYSERLFLKALVIMIVKRLHTIHELLQTLAQPTYEMEQLRECLKENGKYPSRRTFERRLARLPDRLPAQIGYLGRFLVCLLHPFKESGRAASMDSTVLRAKDGAVWHKKDREAGRVPHSRIDTEAAWTKSGWHHPEGTRVYGWKLHLASTASCMWIPLAAQWTPANTDDGEIASDLLVEIPLEIRFVLGDQHYNREELRSDCHLRGIELVTSQPGKYPHSDEGVEVRRVFHKLRSVSIENFNEHFKGIFDSHAGVPTKGWVATARFALGAVLTYQLALWCRFLQELDLHRGMKHWLRAA